MKVISAAMLSSLLCTVLSAALKVKVEHKTAFFGEDVFIDIPADNGEVVFEPRSNGSREVLVRGGRLASGRGQLMGKARLVLEGVREEDEGTYTVGSGSDRAEDYRLLLVVRDCALEEVVKYGDSYNIPLNKILGPITLEFRPSSEQQQMQQRNDSHDQQGEAEAELPAVVLYNQTGVPADEYADRLTVSERRATLHAVAAGDEGSYAVLDRDGKVRRRSCLNVREHQNFLRLPYGGTLKVNLYLHHSMVSVVYAPHGHQGVLVVDRGVPVEPLGPQLEGRLTVEGSVLMLKKLCEADAGMFKVTDLSAFPVSTNYLEVEAYKLSPMYVPILSLVGLIAFLLLVCLLSCLYKVHRRNEKNKKLTLIAQQAGRGGADTFRQVVHEAYSKFTEESQMQSTWDDNQSESTEVTIKGLEVSNPGRYQPLPSYKAVMETSDSGVEFPSISLPLDSDTDGPTFASHRLLLDAASPIAVDHDHPPAPDGPKVAGGAIDRPTRTPDSALSASPTSGRRSSPAGGTTPNGILSPPAASPGAASGGAVGDNAAAAAKTPEVEEVLAGAGGEEAEEEKEVKEEKEEEEEEPPAQST